MRQRLYHRLRQLEAESARIRSLREAPEREAGLARLRRRMELFMRIRGVEKTGMESWFDTFARALGVGNRQLRADILAGIDPIKRWFSENGVYEEMERRKAAGRWPAAGGCSADVRL